MELDKFFYKLIRKFVSKDIFLKNVFKTTNNKSVLISYIVNPFIDGENNTNHTNIKESWIIARIFRDLNYNVDVINYNSTKNISYHTYDVIFGFGNLLEKCLKERESVFPYVIYYSTGSHPVFSNTQTTRRMIEVFKKTGIWMPDSTRLLPTYFPLQSCYSDLMILKGNEFIKRTYSPYSFSSQELIYTMVHQIHTVDFLNKDFSNTKKNFLWFSGMGAIHKGLDVLIDYFCQVEDVNLYICGKLESERNFFNFYKEALKNRKNIFYYGFVDISSLKFKQILNDCSFVIMPSCSEANCASVITVMLNGGLIPVVTPNSGVEVEDFGLLINEISFNGINEAIQITRSYSTQEILNKSRKSFSFVSNNNTTQRFTSNFKTILQKYGV